MKEQKRRTLRHFDVQSKLGILMEYYTSGGSLDSICRKYSLCDSNIRMWERKFALELLPLPSDISEIERQVFMGRVKKSYMERAASSHPMSEEERLCDEVSRLRKALKYSELRNEALSELLKIGCEQYGIDLLKKTGAKQ